MGVSPEGEAAVETSAAPVAEVRLVSVNIGEPRHIGVHDGVDVISAIGKHPVGGDSIVLSAEGLQGDHRASPVHGGPDAKLYVYPYEHLAAWTTEYERSFSPGAIGENLTVAGGSEAAVCVGDVWAWGDALLQVTQPRQPCYKLALQMDLADLPSRFEKLGRCGWYMRVLRAGVVPVAGPIAVVERDGAGISVLDAQRAARRDGGMSAAACHAVAAHPALGSSWRARVVDRLGGVIQGAR
jgi:MOSC domain-containing protein YiiM